MTALPPRRLRPSIEKRQDTSVATHTALSGQGSVSSARPVAEGGRTAVPYVPPPPDPLGFDRITVYKSISSSLLTASQGQFDVSAWSGTTVDEGGSSIALNSPDDGGIYVFVDGLYAVNITVYIPGAYSSPATMMLQAGVNTGDLNNTPTATWHGDDAITGSTPFSTGSVTNFMPGRGFSGGIFAYLLFKNVTAPFDVSISVDVVRVR